MAQYQVFGVGNALVDMEYHISPELLTELDIEKGVMTLIDEERHNALVERLASFSHKRACGGSAANTIIGTAQLGGQSFYSCKVASDESGYFYIDDMNNCKVDTGSLSDNLIQGTTGKCIAITTPDADRTLNTYLGITADLSPKDVNVDAIRNSEYVYIEGYLVTGESSQEAAMLSATSAREANVKTALTLSDPNMVKFFKDNLLAIAGNDLDLLFCNEHEAMLITGEDNIEQSIEPLKQLSKNFVITKGSDGAIVFDGQQTLDVNSYKVDAIDTNGAGDMFAGGYLYGITHGMSCIESANLASYLSAQLVTEYGPRLTPEQVQAYLKTFLAQS